MRDRTGEWRHTAQADRLGPLVVAIPLAAVILTAFSIESGRSLPIVGALALAIGVALVMRPRLAVVAMALCWGGAIAITWQTIKFGPLHLTVGDLCMWAGIAGLMLERRRARTRRPPSDPPFFTVPIILFYVAVAWGLLVAIRGGESLGESFHTGLNCAPLLGYFLMREVYAGRSADLFRDLVLVTVASSAAVLVAMAVKFEPLIGRSQNLVLTRGVDVDTTRIDPPVLRIMCITLLLASFAKIPREGRLASVRWIFVPLMLVIEAFSLTRTTWLPMIAAWLVLPLLAWGWAGANATIRRAAALGVVLVTLLSVASSGTFGPTPQAMAVRAMSVTDNGITKDPSLEDRLIENTFAIKQIRAHPFAGIGFPRAYGASQYSYDPETDFTLYIDKHFIHQTYLGTWMWFGLLGVVALLGLLAYMVRAIVVIWNMRYRDLTAPVAIVAGLAALAFSSAFQTNLIYRPAYFAVAAGLACLDVWIGERRMPREHVLRESDRAAPAARPLAVTT